MSYLLGANALLQLCIAGSKATQWAEKVPFDECRISVVAVAIAKSVIKTKLASDLVKQQSYTLALEARIQTLRDANALLVPIDELVANSYSMWRTQEPLLVNAKRDGKMIQLPASQDTRMVIATAHAHGYTLVEPAEPYHGQLILQNMKVVAL
jgi:hypothetical protein